MEGEKPKQLGRYSHPLLARKVDKILLEDDDRKVSDNSLIKTRKQHIIPNTLS